MEREKYAYSQICYPLIPKFYGITKKEGYCVIEYIKGATLDKIVNELSFDEKITIIFEIMMTICYLHQHYLIYRDLKPNNVIIDDNKNAVLIDFDCLKELSKVPKEQNEDHTANFDSNFMAPEIFKGILTYKSDVYSIGKMIDFIMNGESSKDSKDGIRKIYQSTINENENLRPSVPYLIKQFYDTYKVHIKIDNLHEFFNEIYPGFVIDQTLCYTQCFLGVMYFQGEHVARNIDRAIHFFTLSANQNKELLNLQFGPSRKAQIYSQTYLGSIYENDDKYKNIGKSIHFYKLAADNEDSEAQFYLGALYEKGRYVNPDINKAIHYYSLAANKNHPKAQFQLGLIYDEGRFVNQDIKKAIHYYTLAADQNQVNAQVRLSQIYHHGINVKPNAEKAIKYYQLLSKQNIPEANYRLAGLYYEGKYIKQDINNAIYYLTLAADQNHLKSQVKLALMYDFGVGVKQDISKAIKYYSLAAKQNDLDSQFNLGVIYGSGSTVPRDINKAIYYYSLASNCGHHEAQLNLANIFYEGKYIKQDIGKAIQLYKLAAEKNDIKAQYNLGVIYYQGKYIKKDIEKAIYYFKLAADQNDLRAQFQLGIIYEKNPNITQDIYKAIHYYTLAANQNYDCAQVNLGLIYDKGEKIQRDINKAIHYYSLAAKQNNPKALYNLGSIYLNKSNIMHDFTKGINYYMHAANLNEPHAQFELGFIYFEGNIVQKNISLSVNYFSLAANHGHSHAQYVCGLFHYEGKYIPKNINKGINLFFLSAYNGFKQANFALGYLYHEGKNIWEAIKYYKEASSFNVSCAKNNLGVIYKKGFGTEIKANTGKAIEFFDEAIRQKNDILSMTNLANIYMYDKAIKHNIDKSIELLIKSYDLPSIESKQHQLNLLFISLIKKYGFQKEEILREIAQYANKNSQLPSIIYHTNFLNDNFRNIIEGLDKFYDDNFLLYDIFHKYVLYSDFTKEEKNAKSIKKIPDISFEFYEGFGKDLL